MQTVFAREDLPPPDRLAALNELFVTSEHPMSISSHESSHFQGAVRAMDLAAVNVVELTVSASDVLRTPRMIRQTDPELVCFAVACTGKLVVRQAGREAVLEATDIALYDSSRPFGLRFGAGGEPTRMIRAHIPRALLGVSPDRIERLLARPLTGQAGFGGLLVPLLHGLTTDAQEYRPDDLPRLSTLAADLMTAVVAHHLGTDAAVPEDSRQRALLLRIEAFVRQHLHDPALSPTTVAVAHSISVSYLHRLFSARETTVAAWIRRLRLERARQDLVDPALRDLPVRQIAARWGFKDHPTFTRAFRAAYGTSPTDHRHDASPSRTALT